MSDHFSTPDQPGILRTWQVSRHLCEQGDQVTVVAPTTHYLFSGAAPRTTPLPPGLTLVSLSSPPLDRSRTSSRLRYYLSQLVGATTQAWRAGRGDVLVAGQTPSVLSLGPYLVARVRRMPFVLDERDLALDAAAELGLLPGPVLALAAKTESFLHRHADAVLAVTPGLRRRLQQRGVPEERLWLVPNGFDALEDARTPGREKLRAQLGWSDKVVLIYAGGLGRAYDLDPVFDAVGSLRSENLLLAVLGDGERGPAYRRRAEAEDLPVQFMDPRAKNEVNAVCRGADIGLIPLSAVPRSSYVLSNKLFDYLGSGTPVVATGPGDTADLLLAAGAGLVAPAGDATATASAIARLARDPQRRAEMGKSGERFVTANWGRERFVRTFREALLEVVYGVGPPAGDLPGREADRIRDVYRTYDTDPREQAKRSLSNPGVQAMAQARWGAIRRTLERSPVVNRPKVLDVGCGSGADLSRIDDLWRERSPLLYGVDLLPDRIARARQLLPAADLRVASADRLPFPDGHFDVVLASTLFSSILDQRVSRAVAAELLRVLAPDGAVLCYDVRLPNPANPNTRPITRRILGQLFEGADVSVESLTLLPPLARRLGRLTDVLYGPLQWIAPLRSHYLAVITHQRDERELAEVAVRRTLFVAHAEHRFPNMTVNQRLRALSSSGPVDVLSCYPDSFPEDIESRVRVIRCPMSSRVNNTIVKLSLFTWEAAIWALLHRRYQLVYSFQDTSAVAGCILGSRGTRWVLDAVDDPGMELANAVERRERAKSAVLRARDALLRFLVPRADLVCTIGWSLHDPLPRTLTTFYGADPERVLPLNQAIDVGAVAAVGRHVRREARPLALFVGFISPLRGVDTLLEAGRILRHQGMDMEIELVGHLQTRDREWLNEFARANPGLVSYRGVLPSKSTLRLMARTTVGVLPFPPRREMLPAQAVTGLEYLALGTPMVGTRLPGMATLIEEGVNGFLVEPGDARAMADAIAKVTGNDTLARSMSVSARARADRFDISDVNRRLTAALSA